MAVTFYIINHVKWCWWKVSRCYQVVTYPGFEVTKIYFCMIWPKLPIWLTRTDESALCQIAPNLVSFVALMLLRWLWASYIYIFSNLEILVQIRLNLCNIDSPVVTSGHYDNYLDVDPESLSWGHYDNYLDVDPESLSSESLPACLRCGLMLVTSSLWSGAQLHHLEREKHTL